MKTLWGSSAGACAESLHQEGLSRVTARGWGVGGLELGLGRVLILRRRVTGQKKLAKEQTAYGVLARDSYERTDPHPPTPASP